MTKTDILSRLYGENHITFSELLTLAQSDDSRYAVSTTSLKKLYTPIQLVEKMTKDDSTLSRDFSQGQLLEIVQAIYNYL